MKNNFRSVHTCMNCFHRLETYDYDDPVYYHCYLERTIPHRKLLMPETKKEIQESNEWFKSHSVCEYDVCDDYERDKKCYFNEASRPSSS